MNTQLIYGRKQTILWAVSAILVFLGLLLVAGCTDTLEGERNANQRPIVRFANIPPEGQTFSRNPIVYWYGTDVDGLISQYRYHIRPVSEMGAMDPEDYILGVSDDDWVYIDVDPASAEPQTTQSLSLVADTSNPVRGFVAQWVFLQAFDLEGLGSEIVYRQFSRNDNPPSTSILDFASSLPFVNAPQPGGIVTGVRLSWIGQDRIDYPTDPPPFEFQWRLYGPYDSLTLVNLRSRFVKTVFQSNDGFVYESGDTFLVCDTTYVDSVPEAECDTFIIGTDTIPSFLGTVLTNGYLDISDTGWTNPSNPFNVIADSSDGWVTETSDTIYNVYKHYPTDSTIERWFVFWIRSRDDARVPDPTPAFASLNVIEPRYERDVFVMDMTVIKTSTFPTTRIFGTFTSNSPVFLWWRDRLQTWAVNSLGDSIVFEYPTDYGFKRGLLAQGIPLKTLLAHKVLIIYNDGPEAIETNKAEWVRPIAKAIDAGVNCWVTGRAVDGSPSDGLETPILPHLQSSPEGILWSFYFAVSRGVYTGWFRHASAKRPPPASTLFAMDLQDCVGGYSLNEALWPSFEYDSARVHSLYTWNFGPTQFWNPDLPYLSEVCWTAARYGAEVMYLYKSHFGSKGAAHPAGVRETPNGLMDFNFQGAPIGHRYNSGLFKTVHLSFTMYAIHQSTPEQLANVNKLVANCMDFVYDPTINTPVSDIRYDDAAVKLSVSEQRARYWKRCDMETIENGGEISQEAWRNLGRR